MTPSAPLHTHTPVQLMRRWVVDYFNSHDASTAHDFIAADYSLEIGDYVFAGRDEQWLPAVAQQMQTFPGMGMTIHQVVSTHDKVAAYFSEHGTSNGRTAVWSGVGIYRSDGQVLTGCIAQEDYMTRQRQLKSGMCDPVESPSPNPWDTVILPANPQAESVVCECLLQAWPSAIPGVRCDDEHITDAKLVFEVTSLEFTEIFSSGDDVAFHVRQTGIYTSGFAGLNACDVPMVLNCNGIVKVAEGKIISGRVIRDRLGLKARLQKATP
jgi:predicted ester cyclase